MSEARVDFSLRIAPTVRTPIVEQIRTFVPFGRYDEPQIPAIESSFFSAESADVGRSLSLFEPSELRFYARAFSLRRGNSLHVSERKKRHTLGRLVDFWSRSMDGTARRNVIAEFEDSVWVVAVHETEEGSAKVVTDKALQLLRIFVRHFRWVGEVLVFFLTEPARRVLHRQTRPNGVRAIFPAAVPNATQVDHQ